jgi:hypothetical protein
METARTIEVSALRKVYPGGAEAAGRSIRRPRQQCSAAGPNGAGKSTTIGCDRRSCRLVGCPAGGLTSPSRFRRATVSVVFRRWSSTQA